MTGSERRAYPRIETDLACLVDGETEARIKNMSLGGALVVGPAGLGTIDDVLSLDIQRADAAPMSLFSDVVRVSAGAERFQYGVRFLAPETHRLALEQWIDALARAAQQARGDQRRVTGALFVDYVRMLRRHKGADWSRYLKLEDYRFLQERVEPGAWYPMEAFERMGLAILSEVAGGDLSLVQGWGRVQLEELAKAQPQLVSPGDPRDSLMRFQVLRNSFFDYAALDLVSVSDGEATVSIGYGMSPKAEEAASLQAMGFFVRLLELSGAREVKASFSGRAWSGQPATLLELSWAQ